MPTARNGFSQDADAARCNAGPAPRATPVNPVVHGSSSNRLARPNVDGTGWQPSNEGPPSALKSMCGFTLTSTSKFSRSNVAAVVVAEAVPAGLVGARA